MYDMRFMPLFLSGASFSLEIELYRFRLSVILSSIVCIVGKWAVAASAEAYLGGKS